MSGRLEVNAFMTRVNAPRVRLLLGGHRGVRCMMRPREDEESFGGFDLSKAADDFSITRGDQAQTQFQPPQTQFQPPQTQTHFTHGSTLPPMPPMQPQLPALSEESSLPPMISRTEARAVAAGEQPAVAGSASLPPMRLSEQSSLPPMISRTDAQRRAKDDGLQPSADETPTAGDDRLAILGRFGASPSAAGWSRWSLPAEAALLFLVLLLLCTGRGGGEWLLGLDEKGELVRAGLDAGRAECAAAAANSTASTASACALAAAGARADTMTAAALGALIAAAIALALELADRAGRLAAARARLQQARFPLRHLYLARPACWAALLLLLFGALLLFANHAPRTLGSGFARLGASYGATRLALLFALLGFGVHVTLVQGIGEATVLLVLDSGLEAWRGSGRRQKATMALLLLAAACELLLAYRGRCGGFPVPSLYLPCSLRAAAGVPRTVWRRALSAPALGEAGSLARRSGLKALRPCVRYWGSLLVAYGLWSVAKSAQPHLGLWASATLFSVMTDALDVAYDGGAEGFTPPLVMVLMLCKLVSVAVLVYNKDVFAFVL